MSTKVQLACAWTGPIMVVIWVVSFIAIAGYIPPPSPREGAQQILRFYATDTNLIRLGLLLTMFASALLVPFAAVIAMQMKRIEGRRPVLAYIELAQGTLLSLEFIVPIMVWQAAAYRPTPERLHVIHTLSDMGWLMFVGVISTVCMQVAVFGIAVLMDTREEPIFPRWLGYYTLWTALLLAPAGIVVLFKHGPFAWNGLLAFWMPLTVFCVWVVVTFIWLVRAVRADQPETVEAAAEAVLA
jgi:hypothetical protein